MIKKLSILLLVFLFNIFNLNAQRNGQDSSVNQQHKTAELLLKKSKKQKTVAWILLGAGAGVSIIGYAIGSNSYNPDHPLDIFPPGALAGGAMILGAAAMAVSSVPFFIASGRNKKKANLILRKESQTLLPRLLNKSNVFSVGVSLRL